MHAGEAALPGGDFRLLVQRMGYQALIGLGFLENPVTGERKPNLPSARGVLADLAMLREKTAGNLDPDEAEHLEKVLADLAQALAHASRA